MTIRDSGYFFGPPCIALRTPNAKKSC